MNRTKFNLWSRLQNLVAPPNEVDALKERIRTLETNLSGFRDEAAFYRTKWEEVCKQRDESFVEASQLRLIAVEFGNRIWGLIDAEVKALEKELSSTTRGPGMAPACIDDIGLGDRDDGQPVI